MGCKRPFEEMEFEELPFKHSRHLEYSNKPASFSEVVSSYNAHEEHLIAAKDEGASFKFQWTEEHEKETAFKASTFVDKDFVTNKTLSLVTKSCAEKDTISGPSGAVAYRPLSPGYFEYDFPRRTFVSLDDVYSSSLDCSPRRQVPVGPNHQACIPIWRGKLNEKKVDSTELFEPKSCFSHSLGSDVADNCNEEKLVGTCVLPMPDSNSSIQESGEVANGRTECGCLDAGSIRCVRQHVTERRKILRKTLGDVKFVNLGFCEMGEEVSCKWSEEEELIFHEGVYSNPASMGRNFWKQLSAVFPSRSKQELVSYYFNVFMLRKRAAQNRSELLEIDSDDDEWHGSNEGLRAVRESEDDEDSAIESLDDHDEQLHHEEDFSEDESEDDDSSDGGNDCDGNVENNRGVTVRENGSRDHMSEAFMPKLVDGCKFDPVDKISGNSQDDFVFQDDSCMSFECQTNMSDSCGPVDTGSTFKVSDIRSEDNKCLHSKLDSSGGLVDHLYITDPCDAKDWDARYITGPVKGFDLQPWNMIEDIFGEGKENFKTWDG
ncbi:SANT/Myb domain containing protein [Trema orientale]|uniref:SANT/Myb domain containing protein n=1 Tax=Trema orientale TaxID=63057 RepID=A0A2P5BU77_TREOI|nr:SANT/Myb domain containing protein [Trema orientale]